MQMLKRNQQLVHLKKKTCLQVCLFLLENISLFAVRFMVYGDHRHFQQFSSHRQTLSHNVVSSTPRHARDSNAQL